MKVGLGFSVEKNPILAVREAVTGAKLNLNSEKLGLVIVMGTSQLSHAPILKAISGLIPDVPIFGSTASAIITSGGVFTSGLAVMLLDLSPDVSCTIGCSRNTNKKSSFLAGEELGYQLVLPHNLRKNLAVILSDASIQEDVNFVFGIQEKLGKSFPFVGAYNSNILNSEKTNLYYNSEVLSNSCTGLLFSGKLNFGLGVSHGWNPLGKPHIVTAAQDNTIALIDDKPAVKLYEEYLGWDKNRIKNELKHISILYPLGMYLAEEKKYLLRNVISVDDNGILYFHGNIPQGSQVRLMIGTKNTCLSATQEAIDEAKASLDANVERIKENKSRFALIFSSMSRFRLLGRDVVHEYETIKRELGSDIPFIGFYTYGELAPLKEIRYQGQVYLHNQTINVLLLEG